MRTTSTFIISLLVLSFFFIALVENGNAQGVPFEGCCQFVNSCQNLSQDACIADPTSMEFFINEECSPDSNLCPSFVRDGIDVSNVPTLSEWGLIAMAGILGLAGFIVVRRRKVTA